MRCVFVVRVILLRVGRKSFAKTLQVGGEGVGPGGSAGLLCRLTSGGEICRKVGLHRRKQRRGGPLINDGFGGVRHSKSRYLWFLLCIKPKDRAMVKICFSGSCSDMLNLEMRRGKSHEPSQMFYVGLLAVKRSALALFLPPVAPAVEGGLRKVSDVSAG
jgi:hypothetical protein